MRVTDRAKQKVFLIRRRADGLYLAHDKVNWTDDPAYAFIVSRTKFKGVIRVDLGRDLDDYAMVEAVPAVRERFER